MERVGEIIKQNAKNNNSIFVFPTAAEAREWFLRSLDITGLPSMLEERFLCWEVFKNKFFVKFENLKPVTQIMRKIFAENILAKNKEDSCKGKSLFKKILPEKYASLSENFSSWVIGILPQLENLKLKSERHFYSNEEISEFLLLKKYYEAFLEKHDLYEPSWNKNALELKEKSVIVFFPELIETFAESAEVINSNENISCIHTDSLNVSKLQVVEFENSRTEIEYCISKIESLLSSGVNIFDIALSVCNLQELKPYIKREASIRGIPLDFRTGEKLGTMPVGRLFSSISNIVSSKYSFEEVSTLFLNTHFPWKAKNIIHSLLDFGREFSCVISWQENDKWVVSWEEAFESISTAMTKEQYECSCFFSQAKKYFERMTEAKTFKQIKEAYIEFAEVFFEEGGFTEIDDLCLASCIEKLSELILLENEFSNELSSDRFSFFCSVLNETLYVYNNTNSSVSVFQYELMAVSPFKYNFLLNVSEKEGRSVFNHLSFLRDDVKELLGSTDTDVSRFFLRSYCSTQNPFLSYSRKTFSSYAMCHPVLERTKLDSSKLANTVNSFYLESKAISNAEEINFELYVSQKKGITNFTENLLVQQPKDFSFLRHSIPATLQTLINEELKYRNYINDNKITISQSQLGLFATCPTKFFLQSVIKLRKVEDPTLVQAIELGNLLHEVIKVLLTREVESHGVVTANLVENSREVLNQVFLECLERRKRLNLAFTKLFIEKRCKEIIALLEVFEAEYQGCTVPVIEKKFTRQMLDFMLEGTIDCAFYDKEKNVFSLYDFKTNYTSSSKSQYIVGDTDNRITNFQIPMYVFLLEGNSDGATVARASFWNLRKMKDLKIIDAKNDRASFDTTLRALDTAVVAFSDCLENLDFKKTDIVSFSTCASCEMKNICRTTFYVEGE